jgi:hypothetical protein
MPRKNRGPVTRIRGGHALAAVTAFQKLAEAPFPPKDAFRLAKVIATLNADPNVAALEQTRLRLVRKYGAEDPATHATKVQLQHQAEFVRDYAEVADFHRDPRCAVADGDPGPGAEPDSARHDHAGAVLHGGRGE